ncbi:hypothetical protein, partial [Thermotalea metallivorans]|uniref:hypothetical protein n=1 Tax=Thermotalea metallivorans TaxID=520762 RepID=UPI001A9A4971
LCLRLPSDSTSRWTPLPLANGSHCQAHSGLSPPSYCPCRAHMKEAGLNCPAAFAFQLLDSSKESWSSHLIVQFLHC